MATINSILILHGLRKITDFVYTNALRMMTMMLLSAFLLDNMSHDGKRFGPSISGEKASQILPKNPV